MAPEAALGKGRGLQSSFADEWRRRGSRRRPAWRLRRNFTIRRYREDALSENPTYLSQRWRILEGMRLAGVPEG